MIENLLRRQTVAEWRDRNILLLEAEMNLRATGVREALEAGFTQATASDSLFAAVSTANGQVDALMRAECEPGIARLLATAAAELEAIAPDLQTLAQLVREFAPVWPETGRSVAEADVDTVEDASHGSVVQAVEEANWLGGITGRVGRGVAAVSRSAGAARDSLVNERLGMVRRLRTAASERLAKSWLGVDEPSAVLAQGIILLDRVALEARIRLT